LEKAVEKEPEVLAQFIYTEVGHGEDGISKDEWFGYMLRGEWEELVEDGDAIIDFFQFENALFESTWFQMLQECIRGDLCANSAMAINVFETSKIEHRSPTTGWIHDFTLRRRLRRGGIGNALFEGVVIGVAKGIGDLWEWP